MAGTVRERSPRHYELRAYNRATGRQETRTYVHPLKGAGRAKDAAGRELAKLVKDIEDGKFGGSNATMSVLLDAWIKHGAARSKSPTTLAGYRSKAKAIKAGPLGDVQVRRLKVGDLNDWYDDLLRAEVSHATVNHYHRIIKAALFYAEENDWIGHNPARRMKGPTVPKANTSIPTPAQGRALVLRAAATQSPNLGPIVLWAILTGMRRGEICGLRWGDVDIDAGLVTVAKSVWQVRSNWGIKDPKTHQKRTLSIDPNGVELLRIRRAEAEQDAERVGADLTDSCYIWSAQAAGDVPRTPNSLTRAFHRLCRSMEDEVGGEWKFRLHDCRHLSASALIGAGMDARTVASRLGHANPSVTLNIYAHAIEAQDQAAAAMLGQTYGSLSTKEGGQ